MPENPVPPRVPPKIAAPQMVVPPRPHNAPGVAKHPTPIKSAAPIKPPAALPLPASPAQPVAEVLTVVTTMPAGDAIVASAATYYRTTRYVMVLLLVGMGLWFPQPYLFNILPHSLGLFCSRYL